VRDGIFLAWSGGKDSTLALAALKRARGAHVVALLTTVTDAFDRVSMHGVRRSILRAQAAALDLPVFEATLPPEASNADYDAAWACAIARARHALGPVQWIAYGDLFLDDVRRFREEQSLRLKYRPSFPLWGKDTAKLAHEFVRDGYEAYVTCVDTAQLCPSFAGRKYDETFLRDLPASADPCGERGEFHTCVVGGPLFAKRIPVTVGERTRRCNRFEYCDLVPVPPDAPPYDSYR
jgi:uncharacterized protein (TIGR00290 family)